jgi:hypothetical protein
MKAKCSSDSQILECALKSIEGDPEPDCRDESCAPRIEKAEKFIKAAREISLSPFNGVDTDFSVIVRQKNEQPYVRKRSLKKFYIAAGILSAACVAIFLTAALRTIFFSGTSIRTAKAHISYISGSVFLNNMPAASGASVRENDSVSTGSNSSTVISFTGGAFAALSEKTALSIAEISVHNGKPRITINQSAGSTFSKIAKGGSEYSVQSRFASAEAKGTSFLFICNTDNAEIKLLHGKLLISGDTGRKEQRFLEQGYLIRANKERITVPEILQDKETKTLRTLDTITLIPGSVAVTMPPEAASILSGVPLKEEGLFMEHAKTRLTDSDLTVIWDESGLPDLEKIILSINPPLASDDSSVTCGKTTLSHTFHNLKPDSRYILRIEALNTRDHELFKETSVITHRTVSVNSPENMYYEYSPILRYKTPTSGQTKILIDGEEKNIKNGEKIEAETGLHTIIVIYSDNGGNSTERSVSFFINRLKRKDSDTFNSSDNSLTAFSAWKKNSLRSDDIAIRNRRATLVSSIGGYNWSHISKKQTINESDEFIQKNDMFLSSAKVTVESGVQAEHQQCALTFDYTPIDTDNSEISFYLKEFISGSPKGIVMAPAKKILLKKRQTEEGLTAIYHKKGTSYCGILMTPEGRIIEYVRNPDYKRSPSKPFYERKLILSHKAAETVKDLTLVQVDNYNFYE